MNTSEFIDQILKELSVLMETSGVSRALSCVRIAQMLNTLNEGCQKREEEFTKEKQSLLTTIDKLTKKEENQNGRDNEQ